MNINYVYHILLDIGVPAWVIADYVHANAHAIRLAREDVLLNDYARQIVASATGEVKGYVLAMLCMGAISGDAFERVRNAVGCYAVALDAVLRKYQYKF